MCANIWASEYVVFILQFPIKGNESEYVPSRTKENISFPSKQGSMAYKFGKPFHVYEAFDKVHSSPLLAHYQSEQITVLFLQNVLKAEWVESGYAGYPIEAFVTGIFK